MLDVLRGLKAAHVARRAFAEADEPDLLVGKPRDELTRKRLPITQT